jgi:dolichol-phosphate mannosyltransferase
MEQIKEKNFASAVVYLYNDEERVLSFIEGLDTLMSNNFIKYEIIVVNDHSSDKGAELVKRIASEEERSSITLVNMSFHQGIEIAMNAGLDLAIGDFVFEFDSVYVDYEWNVVVDIYFHSLKGYDIVNAYNGSNQRFGSKIFYWLMNRYAKLQYQLGTETFRVLSRRAINRIHSIIETVSYRKAAYANCGLKAATLVYKPIEKISFKVHSGRINLALNSLILFTDIAFRATVTIALLMVILTIGVSLYALIYWFLESPVEGWTTTVLFLSFSFCCLFLILSMILKYLSTLVRMNFLRKTYIYESIEKLH